MGGGGVEVAPRLALPALSDSLEAGYATASVFIVQVRSVARDVCEDILLVQADDIRSSKGLAMAQQAQQTQQTQQAWR